MAANDVVGVQNVGNKVIVQNVGAKRIAGADLVAQGKIAGWMFIITDIDQMAFFANQGTDVWIGGFGQIVAGSTTLRLGLQPFEGQKYYDLDLNTAFTYTGGAWGGGAIMSNLLSPTVLMLKAPATLTRGRLHELISTGNYVIPPNSTALEDSLDGHFMQLYVPRANTSAVIIASNSDVFIDDVGNESTTLALVGGGIFTLIYDEDAGKWEVFAVDLASLQSQITAKLDKSTTIGAGVGIVKTGTLEGDDLVFAADFATPAEASNPSITNKVISPANIASAVTAATRGSEFNNITGMLPAATEAQFLMTTNVDRTKVDFPEFTAVFNPDPFIRLSLLDTVVVPAGQFTLADTGALPTTFFISVNDSGVISQSLTQVLREAVNEFHLGVVVEIDGEVAIGVTGDVINNGPWLASTETSIRIAETTVSGGVVAASVTAGKVQMDALTFFRESVNWEQSTVAPHSRIIGAIDPLVFTYLDRFGNIIGALQVDEVDGNELDDATNVNNNSYSIQIVYSSSEGLTAVLAGQTIFANLTDAQAGIESYSPILPTILAPSEEISRWIVRGSQFPGSGTLDLTDPDNFVASSGSSITGGATSNSAINISSSVTNNNYSSTNVQEQLDEVSERTRNIIVTPVNSLPAPVATDVSTTPTLTASAFAVQAVTYGTTEDFMHAQFLIATEIGFSNIVVDSGKVEGLNSYTVLAEDKLESETGHYWKVRYFGKNGVTPYSIGTVFTTAVAFSTLVANTPYVGNGGVQNIISGIDHTTGKVLDWIKSIDAVHDNLLFDTVRGVNKYLSSNQPAAETTDATSLTAFNNNGITLGAFAAANTTGVNYIAWQLKAAQGFMDILLVNKVSASETFSHGINETVGMIIAKDNDNIQDLAVWHKDLTTTTDRGLKLNTTDPEVTDPTLWNSTAPTNTQFTLGSFFNNANISVLVFAHNPARGIFCGSYDGTGVTGNKIVTNFPVGRLMIRHTTAVLDRWYRFDIARNPSNPADEALTAESNLSIASFGSIPILFEADGFTVNTTFAGVNELGSKFIFKAVADPTQF